MEFLSMYFVSLLLMLSELRHQNQLKSFQFINFDSSKKGKEKEEK